MLKNPVVVDNQERTTGAAIRGRSCPAEKNKVGRTGPEDLQERNFVMDERKISQLFTRYFNNKMTLLLYLIQAQKIKPSPKLIQTVRGFLGDLFRHMLQERLQKRYRLVFKWLDRFFERLPDVSVYQREKAKDFIRAIYDAFGLHLKNDI